MSEWWNEYRPAQIKRLLQAAERFEALEESGGLGESLIHQATVELDHDQIRQLPTIAVEVVPTPGTNRVIIPLLGVVKVNTIAGAYTVDPAASWMFMLGAVEWSGIQAVGSGLLNTAHVAMGNIPPNFAAITSGVFEGLLNGSFRDISDVANLPLTIKDDYNGVADYTDGNAANTALVTVAYFVWDTTTGTLAA